MSMFTVTGQVINTYEQPGQVDKSTGEVGRKTPKVQILGDMPVQGGDIRRELITLSIEDEKAYQSLVGKSIRVALGFFAPNKGSIVMFIPKGSKPEVIS